MGHAVQISALALLGALICLLRTRKNPMARGFAPVYIVVLRGTPVLMLLLLFYYGVFARAGLACMMGSRVVRASRSSITMRHVRERCERLHITGNMFFNAAFACLLGELNSRSKVLCANVISNRDYATLERTVTMQCRTVPIYLRVTEQALSTPAFFDQLRQAMANANRASALSGEEICAGCGLYFPKITMIYYDRPIDREFLPGCRQVALKTLDSIDTLLLKIYRDEADALYLKFDALLDSTPQEIDRMDERMETLLVVI